MKASQLIAEMQRLIEQHGDLEVAIRDSEFFHAEQVHAIRLAERHQIEGLEDDAKELGLQFFVVGEP